MPAATPEEYLAKKQAELAGPSSGSSSGARSPEEYLKSKGASAAPAPEAPQQQQPSLIDNASTGGTQENAIVNKVSRGLSIGGLGHDLVPFLSAALPTDTDKAMGRDYFDRVISAKAQQDTDEKKSASVDKVLFEIPKLGPVTLGDVAQMTASIPKTVALTAALGKEGLGIGTQGQLLSQGGLEGLTQSDKKSLLGTAGDIGLGALSTWLFGNAINLAAKGVPKIAGVIKEEAGKLGEAEYSNVDLYKKPIEAMKNVKVTETPNDYKIQFGTSPKEIFKMAKDMKASFNDPNVQGAIREELNAQPTILQNKIESTKNFLGTQRDSIIQQIGDKVKTKNLKSDLFSPAYNRIKSAGVEDDVVAGPLRRDLQKMVATFEDKIRTPDKVLSEAGTRFNPSSLSVEDVPAKVAKGLSDEANLKQISEFQQVLGQRIWRDKAYDQVPAVKAAAKEIWGKISDISSRMAEQPGGDPALPFINKAFKAAYTMEDNLVNGSTIKSLTDPQAIAAGDRFDKMVKPLNELPVAVRELYLPDLHNYFLNDFPKTFAKVKGMLAVTERGASNSQASKRAWSLAGLRDITHGLQDFAADKAGSMSGRLQSDVGGYSGSGLDNINRALGLIAPGYAGTQTNKQSALTPIE